MLTGHAFGPLRTRSTLFWKSSAYCAESCPCCFPKSLPATKPLVPVLVTVQTLNGGRAPYRLAYVHDAGTKFWASTMKMEATPLGACVPKYTLRLLSQSVPPTCSGSHLLAFGFPPLTSASNLHPIVNLLLQPPSPPLSPSLRSVFIMPYTSPLSPFRACVRR